MTDDGLVLETATQALNLLQLFSHATPELGVTDMSRRLGLSKSTVSRMVATFVADGVLEKNPMTGRHRLGPLLLELGLIAGEFHPVMRASADVVKRLRDDTYASSFVLLRDGQDGLCLVSHAGQTHITLPFTAGHRQPLTVTVAGWTMLAMDEEISATPPEWLSSEISANHSLCHAIQQIQAVGYGFHEEPQCAGTATIAFPVCLPTHSVIAAVGISGDFVQRVPSVHKRLVSQVARAAEEICSTLSTNLPI